MTTPRTCVNCNGPHTIATCPALAAPVAPSTAHRCNACNTNIDQRTGECRCSD